MRAPARTPRPRGLPLRWASTGSLKLLDRVDRMDESHIVTRQRAAHEPKWSWAAECTSRDPHSGKCQHAPTRAHRRRMALLTPGIARAASNRIDEVRIVSCESRAHEVKWWGHRDRLASDPETHERHDAPHPANEP